MRDCIRVMVMSEALRRVYKGVVPDSADLRHVLVVQGGKKFS